jgi:hypothetical protein
MGDIMNRRIRTLWIAALIVAGVAASGGRAAAATINFSPAGGISLTSLNKITFAGGAISIRCVFTWQGSMQRSALTTPGTEIAWLALTEIRACEGGVLTRVLGESELTFVSLTATGFEALFVFGVNLRINPFGITVDCLYSGVPGLLIAVTSGTTGLATLLTSRLAKSAGPEQCPSSVTVSGSFGLSQQRVTLT